MTPASSSQTIYVVTGAAAQPRDASGRGLVAGAEAAAAEFGLRLEWRTAPESRAADDLLPAEPHEAAGLIVEADVPADFLRHALAADRPVAAVDSASRNAREPSHRIRLSASAPLLSLSGFGDDSYRLAVIGLASRRGLTRQARS